MRKDFLNRKFRYFISYSHHDSTAAYDLVRWLEDAGISTWIDKNNMPAGGAVRENLAEKISQSQGAVILASKNSLGSDYVSKEIDQVLIEQEDHPWFPIIILNIDGCDISSKWKKVRTMVWRDAPEGQLDLNTAAEILSRHHSFYGWDMPLKEQKEIYVSHGWRVGEEDYWSPICKHFIDKGVRLVGDLVNQPGSDEGRISRIMESCGGHLMILPAREGDPEKEFKYLLKEAKAAKALGLPTIVIGDDQKISSDFTSQFDFFLGLQDGDGALEPLDDDIEHFIGSILADRAQPYTFFASQYKGNFERNRLARRVIESAGALPCRWGHDFRGDSVAKRISNAIQAAAYTIADLSSFAIKSESSDSPRNRDRTVNVNACIEAGIARGAGKTVKCLSAADLKTVSPEDGKSTKLPFMFRNDSISWYEDEMALLATVHALAQEDRFKFGRRIINHEYR